MSDINKTQPHRHHLAKYLLEPEKDRIAEIIENIQPAPANHPYLLSVELAGLANVSAYAGDQIVGVDCKGCFAAVIHDSNGKAVNLLVMVQSESGEYENLFIPGAPIAGAWIRIGAKTDTIYVVTDLASGLTLHHVTGNCVAITVYDKNLPAVCESLREKNPEASIVICLGKAGSADRTAIHQVCNKAAWQISAAIATPQGSASFSALYLSQGADAVTGCIESTVEPANPGISNDVSDEFAFSHVIAWPDPVNAAGLFANTVCGISRYVVLPLDSIVALMFWSMFAHFIPQFRIAPILALLSAVKRCGKTSTVAIIELLVPRAIPTVNISPASIYHAVGLKPTLLIDEGDRFINDASNELTGILNSGHTRTGAFVWRLIGGKLQRFPTFCAKLLAMIGQPPTTILDRSIVIELQRKPTDMEVAKYEPSDNDEMIALRAMIERFALTNRDRINAIKVEVPDLKNDRARDNWGPLFSVASCGGPEWVQMATSAAVALTSIEDESQDAIEILLADICELFKRDGAPFLATSTIISELCSDKEKRWATFNRGGQISPHDLANLLRQVKCRSRQQRVGDRNVRGYHLDDMRDPFARYFPGAFD